MYPNASDFLSSGPYDVWWKWIDDNGREWLCETSGHIFIRRLQSYLRGRFQALDPPLQSAIEVPSNDQLSSRPATASDFPFSNRWDAETIRAMWMMSAVYRMDLGYPPPPSSQPSWADQMSYDLTAGVISPQQIHLAAAMTSSTYGVPYENVQIRIGRMPSPGQPVPTPSRLDYRCTIVNQNVPIPRRMPAREPASLPSRMDEYPRIEFTSFTEPSSPVNRGALSPVPRQRSWTPMAITVAVGLAAGILLGRS